PSALAQKDRLRSLSYGLHLAVSVEGAQLARKRAAPVIVIVVLTSTSARTIIVPHMKKIACILAVAIGCSISREVQSSAKPLTLAREKRTTLHVGELAMLHMPSNIYRRYLHSGPDGAWRDALALVKRSGRDVTFRAVRPGKGVIIISPDVPDGECISCVTIHYFIEVVSQK